MSMTPKSSMRSASQPMAIEPMPVAGLRTHPGNPRTHSKKQVRQIADSIRRFGFTNPVLIGEDGSIIAGHGRVEAAKLLGLDSVPTVRLAHLNAAQRRAYVLADNKLALNAGWDRELLAIELQGLVDIDFDVEVTGFSPAEIDLVLFKHGRRIGVECKRSDAPALTPSIRIALGDLRLDRVVVVYPGDRSYALADHVEVVPLIELADPSRDAAGLFKKRRR